MRCSCWAYSACGWGCGRCSRRRACRPGREPNLLNQYFCTYTGPIDVSEMNLVTDEWPHGSASTDANVQYMGRIDKESDDAILSGDTDLDGAVTTDGQAAGSAN